VRLWTRVKNWMPAIAWACLISWLSTDAFSSQNTSAFILPALHWLFPHASAETLDLMHGIIRKMAHLTEYFIFSIFLLQGVRGKDRGWKLRWTIWAVMIAAAYASFDEFHQSFVSSRTASPWDALLDTVGAAAAQIVMWLWHFSHARDTTANTNPKTESHAEHAE
jgi:VanZ family protein